MPCNLTLQSTFAYNYHIFKEYICARVGSFVHEQQNCRGHTGPNENLLEHLQIKVLREAWNSLGESCSPCRPANPGCWCLLQWCIPKVCAVCTPTICCSNLSTGHNGVMHNGRLDIFLDCYLEDRHLNITLIWIIVPILLSSYSKLRWKTS